MRPLPESQAVIGNRERRPMQTEPASNSRLLEAACDESGYEGEKLIGATTDVFAHASVRLDIESAASCIQEARNRIRSPAMEYKANHLLRAKNRSVLKWLLAPSGPLHGNAHVYLIDKAFFVVSKVIDLFYGGVSHAARIGLYRDQRAKATAVNLYRDGPRTLGDERWEAFLASSNNFMRAKDRLDVTTSVDSFFRLVEVLRGAGARGAYARDSVDEILGLLCQARPHAYSFRAQLSNNPTMIPALDPLFPAIVQAVIHWGEGTKPVTIVHDQQNTLSEDRIAQLKGIFGKPNPALLGYSSKGLLADLRLVDSFSDVRVQVADFLAGVARKIASDELNDRGDAELTALLRPYVDSASIWGDDRSWSRLAPTSGVEPGELSQATSRAMTQ
jgi:hypothetical protein